MFHSNSGSGIACASCHPEAGDDGRAWQFDGNEVRRTQALRGGLLGTEPFHWNGDMRNISHVMREVFVNRMGGTQLEIDQQTAVGHWIDSVPLPASAAPLDVAAADRGRALFNDSSVACACPSRRMESCWSRRRTCTTLAASWSSFIQKADLRSGQHTSSTV